jgi:sterol desaturase/sphingolipid hydroxylase (fatty acid hydroxylase superfamily)
MTAETLTRVGGFVTVLGLMAFWEALVPRRRLRTSKISRWVANISMVVLDTILVRALFAAGAVGAAVLAAERGWGLLNGLSWPFWLEWILAVIALDFVLYLQHVMFHAVPLLWRFHMMHHSDLDCDVTTGVRFHPVEVLPSMFIKLGAVVLLGASALAVVSFEVLLNATSMFNHGNVRMPAGLDRVLRSIVVTPDMHRVHHSTDPRETNRNFGFNLPWWDRVFGTYTAQPAKGHEGMTIGLEHVRDPTRLTFIGMLILPFVGKPGNYPLSRQI